MEPGQVPHCVPAKKPNPTWTVELEAGPFSAVIHTYTEPQEVPEFEKCQAIVDAVHLLKGELKYEHHIKFVYASKNTRTV